MGAAAAIARPRAGRYVPLVLVRCPDCSAAQDARPGGEVLCPACMVTFMAPWIAAPRARWRIARGSDVDAAIWSPFAVREALYTGALDAHARVWEVEEDASASGAPADPARWPWIGSVPEFGAVLRVRGVPLGPEDGARRLATLAETRRRVRIVETSAPAREPVPSAEATTDPAPTPRAPALRVLTTDAPSRPVPAGLVIGGTVLLVALGMWLFLSA